MPRPAEGGEILALTGLRGVAALLIAIYHISFLASGGTGRFAVFMRHGYLWADLFFVLSGFIMGMTYDHVGLRSGLRAYRGFLWRRMARIYPLYATMTVLAFLVFGNDLTWWRQDLAHPALVLLADLTLLQSLHLAPSLDPPAWSISTEWIAYLSFPLLCSATLRCGRGPAIGVGAIAVVVLSVIAFGFGPVPSWQGGSFDVTGFLSARPVARCLGEFSLGLLACRWQAHGRTVSGTLIGAAIVLLMACHGSDLPVVLLFPLLVTALLRERDLLSRLLATAPALWLGRISYAVYLLHMPLGALRLNLLVPGLLERVFPPLGPVWAGRFGTALLYVALLLLASACFVVLERPARNRLLRRPPGASVVVRSGPHVLAGPP